MVSQSMCISVCMRTCLCFEARVNVRVYSFVSLLCAFQNRRPCAHASSSGWGATCGGHRNNIYDIDPCKIMLTMGSRFTSDACELRVRQWLLVGMTVDDTLPNARRTHVMDMKPRRLVPLPRAEQDLSLPV